MTRVLRNIFQVTSEGEALLLKKSSTEIRFDKKLTIKASEGFLLTTKFYKSAQETAFLSPKKRKPERKADVQP